MRKKQTPLAVESQNKYLKNFQKRYIFLSNLRVPLSLLLKISIFVIGAKILAR